MGNGLIIIHIQLIQMRQYLFTVTHTIDISLQFSQHNLIQVLLTNAVTTAGIFPVSVIIGTDIVDIFPALVRLLAMYHTAATIPTI